MQPHFDEIEVLFSKAETFEEMKELPSKKIFDGQVCSFLNALSGLILKNPEIKQYPDIVTFGFFCRKANIEQLKKIYFQDDRMGRGLSFHIAPSNVPINFAYSMVAGLLSGNSCVVRVSTKAFEQIRILCRLMEMACKDTAVGKYIAIVRYERKKEINDYLSSISDVRVIWGGDHTIRQIRESRIPARCIELTFPDRYSLCLMYASDILKISDWNKVAQDFFNDTYLYDQNACSSPRLLYWIGQTAEIQAAKKIFWEAVRQFTRDKYHVVPVIAVDKLTMDYRAAIELKDIKLEKTPDNLFHRIHLKQLTKNIPDYSCPGGSFLEYDDTSLDALKEIITKKYQTLSYLGGNGQEIAEWVLQSGVKGIDRIVPMGNTADFTLTWDGYDLINTMSRHIIYS